ncbi:hypothetical protein PV08_06589 [Exophiala spinifera]|uniref:Transcription factor domain-containing protein n=1 Tax=Exophiala spinifera TaxID=91928 RepID=A0A0D2BZ19_9EURO|nr:uncharacterized protein PV08_06589 [Exophiala spinifera]KIW16534.1 hypothetical protein PV08_06589 [Exophiala spinifera]
MRGAVIAESREGAGDSSPSNLLSNNSSATLGSSRYDTDFFTRLVSKHITRLYPFCPIVDKDELYAIIEVADVNQDAAFLIHAYAGVALLLERLSREWEPNCYQEVLEVVALAIDFLPPMGLDSKPPFIRVLGYIFVEMSLLGMKRLDMAFFYLRGAISLMLMDGLDNFLGKSEVNSRERARRERVYWCCFIHERHLALEGGTPVCLDPLPSLPDVTFLAANSAERGWNYITQTFLLIDRDFVKFWTGDRSLVTAEWVQEKYCQLTDPSWEHEVTMLATVQQADVVITRQWLRTLTWQMAMSNVLLSSEASSSEALSLFMPLRLSTQLKEYFIRLSRQGVAVDDLSIRDKLFEIITTIADVVTALPPSNPATEVLSSIQDLLLVKRVLLGFSHVKPVHRQLLLEKMSYIKSLYRDTTSTFIEFNHYPSHLAHFLFTINLLPILKRTVAQKGSDVRVVNVSASDHSMLIPNTMRFDKVSDLKYCGTSSTSPYNSRRDLFSRYALSKLANILCTAALQQRYRNILCASCNPGGTNTVRGMSVWPGFLRPVMSRLFVSPAVGARPVLLLAAGKDVGAERERYRGAYVGNKCKEDTI